MNGWVGLGSWLRSDIVYLPEGSHHQSHYYNQAQCRANYCVDRDHATRYRYTKPRQQRYRYTEQIKTAHRLVTTLKSFDLYAQCGRSVGFAVWWLVGASQNWLLLTCPTAVSSPRQRGCARRLITADSTAACNTRLHQCLSLPTNSIYALPTPNYSVCKPYLSRFPQVQQAEHRASDRQCLRW